MMVSVNRFDPSDWLQRLEAGEISEPELALAARIREISPELPGPDPEFNTKLRSHLKNQYSKKPAGKLSYRWYVLGFAVLVLTAVVFFIIRNTSRSIPTANAAEILNLAGQSLNSETSQGDVLYDRLLMDWEKGILREQEVVGELWRTPDGSQFRYQMLAGDRLIYFDQQDNEHVWRSSHIRPTEGSQVDFVYLAPRKAQGDGTSDDQLISKLLFRDLGDFWINIGSLSGGENAGCSNPFCVLKVLAEGWECTERICSLYLGQVPIAGDLVVEAMTLEDEWLSNGHLVHQVRLQIAGEDDSYYQVLKFDSTTYDLLEIEDYSRGKLKYRLRLDDRQSLAWSDLPPEFFRTIPSGVEVREWKSEYPLGHLSMDRVWVISSDPAPEAILNEPFNAHVELGYRLTSIEKAAINLGGLNWSGHDTRVKLDVDEVIVEAGEGVVEFDFAVDTSKLGDGRWGIWPAFRDIMDIHLGPGIGWNSFGDPAGIIAEWCIRCQDPAADG